jgi:acyl carrier protein
MAKEIAQKVIGLAAKQADVPAETVTPQHHFVNDLNYDSLDMVEFGMSVEDEFSLTVPDDRLDVFQTVGQVIEFVEHEAR